MDIRVLRYFLMVAREQSFTGAAEQLHITQPTISRQIAELEEELGTKLFVRGSKCVTLTPDGILLKRRAMEITGLEEKAIEEIRGGSELVEGTVTIGAGEFSSVETLASVCETFRKKYPQVQISLHTATADVVYEKLNQGLIDIGIFIEPVNTEGLDYIRMPEVEEWVAGMRPDDPLAQKEYITKEDLMPLPLILPERTGVQSELANWFGRDFSQINIAFTSNLATNASIMASKGLAYPVSIRGAAKYWRSDLIVHRKLYPPVISSTVAAWRRNLPYSSAAEKFIEELNALKV